MIARSNVRHDVQQLLELLGDNVRDIGEFLKVQGIRGKPRDSEDCVIARYLSLVTTGDSRVQSISVLRNVVRVRLAGPVWQRVTIPLPTTLREFILLFDAHYLPDLEDHGDSESNQVSEVALA